MNQIGVAIVGTGWCGGIRAETCAAHPLTKSLHLAEIRPERLAEVARAIDAPVMHADQRAVGRQPNVALDAVGALLDGLQVCGQRVLRLDRVGSPMRDDLDVALTRHAAKPRSPTPTFRCVRYS